MNMGKKQKDDPQFDPTQNVLDLVEAATKRLDDLRLVSAELHSSANAAGETKRRTRRNLNMITSVKGL